MPETLVVDCSIAAKWILPEPGREPARLMLDRYASGEISLIAPDLLLAEFASLISKRVRRKEISGGQAQTAFDLMSRVAPQLFDTRPLVPLALHLSLRY